MLLIYKNPLTLCVNSYTMKQFNESINTHPIPVRSLLALWRERYKRLRSALKGGVTSHSLVNFDKLDNEFDRLLHNFGISIPVKKEYVLADITNLFVCIEVILHDAAVELGLSSNLYCDVLGLIEDVAVEKFYILPAIENGFYNLL